MKPLIEIPLSRPDINEYDRKLVLEVLNTPFLSLGPKVREFESKFATYLGVKHAIAVNSGTSALHLCVKSLGIGDGDLVATTPFSFVASANCLLYERARPLFVDIDPVTLNIDVNKLEEALKRQWDIGEPVKAILPVHVFGRPCEMEAIMELARRFELGVIEDACEALGAALLVDGKNGEMKIWKKVGTFGNCAAFGFYPNKQMTTGEGGIVATNDDSIDELCRSLRNQGRGTDGAWLQHERLGYNYRLSDINCALGVSQLSRIDEMLAMRANVARMYQGRLTGLEDLIVPVASAGEKVSWFVFVVRLNERYSREERDAILGGLREAGIECSNYFTPIHLQPFYGKLFGYHRKDFPETRKAAERSVALPFFGHLDNKCVSYVCESLIRTLQLCIGSLTRKQALGCQKMRGDCKRN